MGEWKGYSPDNRLATGIAEPGPSTVATAGALTYEPHYGLKAKPFSLSTDPRSLFSAPSHAEALDDVLAAIRRREGLIAVMGEMGTGKTTLCRAALYQLDRKTFTTFVPDPFLSREDLLRMLLVDFGEVSFDDLRNGRLANASRPDLNRQLYEFLTSLESVDAFAVLVIDEAQHIASPLADEIRALSELEAGRRLLQIVLVGQPELESHLRQPHLRHLDQRVTTRCVLKPFTREELAGYVSHRLAVAGGTRERVSFSPLALDIIYTVSAGIPRVVNLVCDRALARGQHEQVAVVSPGIVAKAIEDLRLAPGPVTPDVRTDRVPVERSQTTDAWAPVVSAAAVSAPTAEARTSHDARPATTSRHDAPSNASSELTALMDLSPKTRQERPHEPEHAGRAFASVPAWKSRVDAQRTKKMARFRFLRLLMLPLLGMGVMLTAGFIAFNTHRLQALVMRSPSATRSAPVAALTSSSGSTSVPVVPLAAVASAAPTATPSLATQAVSTPAMESAGQTWMVQVAAFSSGERSAALVDKLAAAGLPAYEVSTGSGTPGVLHIVRVGPYRSAADANTGLARVRAMPDLEDAFVRATSAEIR
jgi:type II secretory pathway predicted ATPase ExeA/cell division septation protein DedD